MSLPDMLLLCFYLFNPVVWVTLILQVGNWSQRLFNWPTAIYQMEGNAYIQNQALLLRARVPRTFPRILLDSTGRPMTGSFYLALINS